MNTPTKRHRPPRLPLERCNSSTPECPHYGCPDGFHQGYAPNCACTPDCALCQHGEVPEECEECE